MASAGAEQIEDSLGIRNHLKQQVDLLEPIHSRAESLLDLGKEIQTEGVEVSVHAKDLTQETA